MNLLITGAAGQVGRELSKRADSGCNVLAVDRQTLDITDTASVQKLVREFKPQVIINAAAYTAVDKAESDAETAYAINRDGAAYLAQAAEETGAALLHISTDYVFPGNKEGLYVESDATGPEGVYGSSKLAGEDAIRQYCTRHIIMRTAWVFGEYGNNFVKTMIRLGKDRNTLSVVGDQCGSPTYAGDIAKALLAIAQQIEKHTEVQWGIYHYSGYPYTSWASFAEEIFARAAEKGIIHSQPSVRSITTKEYPTPAVRPLNSQLDCSKILDSFNIKPSDWLTALNDITRYNA